MKIYKSTVELFWIVRDNFSAAEACDATAEMLRDHLRAFSPDSSLLDWRHQATSDNRIESPTEATPAEIASLEYQP
jgi:hypothetical protein